MLTISDMNDKGIVLTEHEKKKFMQDNPTQLIRCQKCNEKTFTIFEYAGLDLCANCCNDFLKVKRDVELRALPMPPSSCVTLKKAERDAVKGVMAMGMNITDSAAALGTTRATLYSKLKEFGIEPKRASSKSHDRKAG